MASQGDDRLSRLRQWRNKPDPDLSLGFLRQQFKQQHVRPAKHLAKVVQAWETLVPAELQSHTKLQTLSRGVLRVQVDSSPVLYELDRLLREGLEAKLIRAAAGSGLLKIRLQVGALEAPLPRQTGSTTELDPDEV